MGSMIQSDTVKVKIPQEVSEKERNQRIVSMYGTGWYSYNKLGRIFKVSPQRIAEIIKRDKALKQ